MIIFLYHVYTEAPYNILAEFDEEYFNDYREKPEPIFDFSYDNIEDLKNQLEKLDSDKIIICDKYLKLNNNIAETKSKIDQNNIIICQLRCKITEIKNNLNSNNY